MSHSIDYAGWAREHGNRSDRAYRHARRAERASWQASASAREWHRHYRWTLATYPGDAERHESARSLVTTLTLMACDEAGRAVAYRAEARRQAAQMRKWRAAAQEKLAEMQAWLDSPERAAWLAEIGLTDWRAEA